jgi:hypothetical protein
MNVASTSAMKRFGSGGTGLARYSPPKSAKGCVQQFRVYSNWHWHLDEMFVRINGLVPV